MNYATVRLGKDSVSDITDLVNAHAGAQSESYSIKTRCKQFPPDVDAGDLAFVWLGSDNGKGQKTPWVQGFRAIARFAHIERVESRDEDTEFELSVDYIFNESINRVDFLREAPTGYYWCCNIPIIGVDDRANQTVRAVESGALTNVGALMYCFAQCQPGLREEVPGVYPELLDTLAYVPPNPRSHNDDTGTALAQQQPEPLPASTPHQAIFFGAPGTGKSFDLQSKANKYFSSLDQDQRPRTLRVAFHPEYSIHQFVGTYRPVVSQLDQISYAFVPGPFARILTAALNSPDEDYLLVIEEINRANPPAVFGELFQLLDRSSNGASEYPTSIGEDFQQYLRTRLSTAGMNTLKQLVANASSSTLSTIENDTIDQIILPNNLYMWATMNSADQGVFPLDTAFKRRWEFIFKDINSGEENCNWNTQRRHINSLLLNEVNANEDKLIGAFFIKTEATSIWGNEGLLPSFKEEFHKVIMYLFDDAARYYRKSIFNTELVGQVPTLSGIIESWNVNNFAIFVGLRNIEPDKTSE